MKMPWPFFENEPYHLNSVQMSGVNCSMKIYQAIHYLDCETISTVDLQSGRQSYKGA